MKWRVLNLQVYQGKQMRKQWQSFLLALGFFTRIPVPAMPDFQERDLNQSAKYFPLVGLLVGVFGALAYLATSTVLPHSLAVLISMMATVYLTGAFHEDGLADSADGLGGGWAREKILMIMQDSRLGTYGAVALFFVLLVKFQLLDHLSITWLPWLLVVAHAWSRLCAVWLMAVLDYTKPAGKAKPLATSVIARDLAIANLFGLLPLLALLMRLHGDYTAIKISYLFGILLLTSAIIFIWWQRKLTKWIGGYTGDTLGAIQQMTEVMVYFSFLAWSTLN